MRSDASRPISGRWLMAAFCLAIVGWLAGPSAAMQDAAGEPESMLAAAAAERASSLGRPVRAAVFVKNRAGASLDQKLRPFEDMVVGRVSAAGLDLISPEDVVTSINRFLREGDDRVRDRLAQPDDSDIDAVLNENTSALRLAQDVGADYLLVVSITDFGVREQPFQSEALGIDRTVVTHQLRAAYRVVSAARGEAVHAGDVVARVRETEQRGAVDQLIVGDLMANASGQIADKLAESLQREPLPGTNAVPLSRFVARAAMQDLLIPEVIETEDGELMLGDARFQVEALAADVLINGSFVGSTGEVIEAPAGFHVMRIERAGFEPWERRVKLPEIAEDEAPAQFRTALEMNERGLARFREMTAFFEDLKNDRVLTEAEAERIRSIGQMFRQSGLRVDIRHASDVVVGWQRGTGTARVGEAAGAVRSAWRRMFPADDAANGGEG